MSAIGINYLKRSKNRDLGDFFESSQEEDMREISEAELSQYEEMQDTEYIN